MSTRNRSSYTSFQIVATLPQIGIDWSPDRRWRNDLPQLCKDPRIACVLLHSKRLTNQTAQTPWLSSKFHQNSGSLLMSATSTIRWSLTAHHTSHQCGCSQVRDTHVEMILIDGLLRASDCSNIEVPRKDRYLSPETFVRDAWLAWLFYCASSLCQLFIYHNDIDGIIKHEREVSVETHVQVSEQGLRCLRISMIR